MCHFQDVIDTHVSSPLPSDSGSSVATGASTITSPARSMDMSATVQDTVLPTNRVKDRDVLDRNVLVRGGDRGATGLMFPGSRATSRASSSCDDSELSDADMAEVSVLDKALPQVRLGSGVNFVSKSFRM